MKNLFLSILLLTIASANLSAQNAFITITADRDCEVSLYEPIDSVSNSYFPTKVLSLQKNKPITCTTLVSSFAFIDCEFSHGLKCKLLLFPNDSVNIKADQKIVFSGKNKTELEYLNSVYNKLISSYMASMENVLIKYIRKDITFNTAMIDINNNIIQTTIENIGKTLLASGTPSRFIETLQKNTQINSSDYLVLLLRSLLQVDSYKTTALKDSIEITERIDSIFKKTMPLEKETLKYDDRNYVAQYLIFYYGEECPPNSNGDFLGYWGNILYAPIDMQPILLGEAYIRQLKEKKESLDSTQIQTFLTEKFPDNEYTAIVIEKLKGEEKKKAENFPHQFIEEDIAALSQLMNKNQLSGKYLFIDIWASWCMPCRKEFAYKEQLNNLLKSYSDMAIVYISIDNNNLEGNWKQCIQNYKLSGTHLRASAALLADIQQQIYGTEEFLIPQYILLSPNGEILHKDLPRPSELLKLKAELDKMVNSKVVSK